MPLWVSRVLPAALVILNEKEIRLLEAVVLVTATLNVICSVDEKVVRLEPDASSTFTDVMVMALKFKMHEAIGTSLAIIIFTSFVGLLGYIVGGWNAVGLPPYSLGYVNFWSWFLLAVSSVGMAQFGALTAHRLPARQLRYLFIILMMFVGLRMIGVFEWVGW